jgi:hypothetical protein
MTLADLQTAIGEKLRLGDAVQVSGPHPSSLLGDGEPASAKPAATHRDRDRRASASAAWIASRLSRDPTLPRRARTWLVHRMHAASEREQGELREWLDVLDGSSIPRIQHHLLDSGERATRLRQTNPFVPVLTEQERDQMRRETLL